MKLLQKIWWWILSWFLVRKVQKLDSPERTEAEEAVLQVVFKTDIPHDCVSAGVLRGGCCIFVKHMDEDSGQEITESFIHNSYAEAAAKAVEWLKLQDDEMHYIGRTKLNHSARRAFDQRRKRARRQDARAAQRKNGK